MHLKEYLPLSWKNNHSIKKGLSHSPRASILLSKENI